MYVLVTEIRWVGWIYKDVHYCWELLDTFLESRLEKSLALN